MVNIRPLSIDDLPAAKDLILQLAKATGSNFHIRPGQLEEIFRHMQQHPEIYLSLVAEQDGEVVGLLSLLFYQSWFHAGGTALINELIIDQRMRNRGIGALLVEAAVIEAKRRGMDEIEVGTEQDNDGAQRFYRRCGFDLTYVLLGMDFDR